MVDGKYMPLLGKTSSKLKQFLVERNLFHIFFDL
jgi:hypothetical protein